MRRALFLAAVSAAVPAMASPFYFNDPTQPNVLREYNLVTRTNAVGSGTVSGVGNNIGRIAANDGTGWNDESSETWQSGDSVTHEWMFVRPHRIGSYNMSVGGGGTPHGTFTVEYFDGANWQPWDSFTGNTWTFTARDPADVVAYGIRYTATDVPPGDRLRLNEFQVRLAGTHPVHIKSGFNWFVDSGRIASTASSTNVPANNWVALNGGNPDTLRDHIYLGAGGGDELKSQLGFNNADADDRAFVRYSFSDPAPIHFAVLGGSNGQGWEHFEIYTANGALPDTTAVSSDMASLIAAGWTLQHAHGAGIVGNIAPYQFDFLQPGIWDHLLIVWNVQHGAMQELELYAVPEPGLLPLAALVLPFLARRRRGT